MLPVDFIMHEYLHKYFENKKKIENFFSISCIRPDAVAAVAANVASYGYIRDEKVNY